MKFEIRLFFIIITTLWSFAANAQCSGCNGIVVDNSSSDNVKEGSNVSFSRTTSAASNFLIVILD